MKKSEDEREFIAEEIAKFTYPLLGLIFILAFFSIAISLFNSYSVLPEFLFGGMIGVLFSLIFFSFFIRPQKTNSENENYGRKSFVETRKKN